MKNFSTWVWIFIFSPKLSAFPSSIILSLRNYHILVILRRLKKSRIDCNNGNLYFEMNSLPSPLSLLKLSIESNVINEVINVAKFCLQTPCTFSLCQVWIRPKWLVLIFFWSCSSVCYYRSRYLIHTQRWWSMDSKTFFVCTQRENGQSNWNGRLACCLVIVNIVTVEVIKMVYNLTL